MLIDLQKTKEEMVQIVVDAVKVNLNKIVGQLTCERVSYFDVYLLLFLFSAPSADRKHSQF